MTARLVMLSSVAVSSLEQEAKAAAIIIIRYHCFMFTIFCRKTFLTKTVKRNTCQKLIAELLRNHQSVTAPIKNTDTQPAIGWIQDVGPVARRIHESFVADLKGLTQGQVFPGRIITD